MRWIRFLIRIAGWLLTPLVAWAASFCAVWLLLRLGRGTEHARRLVIAAFIAGLAAAITALLIWMRLLRHSAKLRHTLHVDREGLPELEEEGADAIEAPAGSSES